MSKPNYGWVKDLEAEAEAIVNVLGGGRNAVNLILETSSAETALGQITDGTLYAGMGICQFDKKPFKYIKDKSLRFRNLILAELGVDIVLVKWDHLRYNSFLSLLFCRLYYMTIRKPIPATREGRAKYWKRYYNSYLGKGTPRHYLKMASVYMDKKESA